MAIKEYVQMLTLPQWQRRRLEIMHRDNFRCAKCGEDEKMLNVHHKKYSLNKKPWEYPSEDLITLCESCHTKEHQKSTVPLNEEQREDYANHPSLFSDPFKASELLKKIKTEQEKLLESESAGNHEAVTIHLSNINSLTVEKNQLRIRR